MSDDETPRSGEDFDARLRQARSDNRPVSEVKNDGGGASARGLSIAFRIGVELVAALVVGVGIGYVLDTWLDTKPWFLVGFFFIGAAAGVLNVYRAASSIGLAPEPGPKDESGGKA